MNTTQSQGRIFLVDDDADFRSATRRLLTTLGFEVSSFASAEEYLSSFDREAHGCLLLDLRMTGASGLELAQRLQQEEIMPPIVFLTAHGDVPTSVLAMRQGAVDFLQKPVSGQDLVPVLKRALERDAQQRRERENLAELRARFASLTRREREILNEMLAGVLNKQAAQKLQIAERTVKLHRANVLEKMGAQSIPELVRMAERLGVRPQ